MSQSPDADPRSDLETALTQIFGLAQVLMELGVEDEVASYLGGQLKQHCDAATLEKIVNELLDVRGNRDFREAIEELARELMRR